MRLAVFSDIHGNYQALKAIIKRTRKRYDEIIFLGDAIDLGPDSLECVKLIQKNNIRFILGNHDLYYTRGTDIDDDLEGEELEHVKWTRNNLKNIVIEDKDNLRYDFKYKNNRFSFFHFFLTDDKYPFEHLDILRDGTYEKVFDKETANYIFYGHNHDEEYREINGKKYYGVGSSGCVKKNKTYFYSISIKDKKVNVKKIKVRFNRKKFVNKIKNINFPDKHNILKIFFGL